jgi:VWFA-related protein
MPHLSSLAAHPHSGRRRPLTSSIVGIAVVAAVVVGSRSIGMMAGAIQPNATVHVSVIDKTGSGVADLQAAEFEVKVGGKKQEVVTARRAVVPLRIAIIVSDAGTGGFQQGLANFMQKLLGHAEFALISVIVQPETVVDYTGEAGVLSAGLRRLGPRGRQRGAQLMEAIQEALKGVRREGARPVFLVVRVGAEAPTTVPGDDVREQLRKSGAILYVVSTVGAQRAAPSQARAGISAEQAQLRADEDADGALNLAQVLGDGATDSGGRHEQVISTTLVPALEQVAAELLNQYEITYVRPQGGKPNDKISVTSKRNGVTVRAPARLPY